MTDNEKAPVREPVEDKLVDEVVERLMDRADASGAALLGQGGLLTEVTRAVLERALDAEMSEHLGYEKHDPAGRGSGNSRNGTSPKTVLTDAGNGQALRPPQRARAHGEGTAVPAHPGRPLPRPPAPTPGRGSRGARRPPSARDQGTRLHRQREPPGPVHHPGPCRGRPRQPLPRKAARLLLTDPDHLREDQLVRDQLAMACPEMTALADAVTGFAALLTPKPANAEALTGWITRVRTADLPFLHAYASGLERDRTGVDHALPCPGTTAAPRASTTRSSCSSGRPTAEPDTASCASASCSAQMGLSNERCN